MPLNPRQRRVLETAMEPGIARSIAAVCEAAGVQRSTFYNWLDTAEFRAAWEAVWYGSVRRHLPGVVAAMIDKAQGGDVQAARLVADMAGVLRQRVEHTGADGGPIEVNDARERLAARLAALAGEQPAHGDTPTPD